MVDSVVNKPQKYVSVQEGDFKKDMQDLQDGSAPYIIKRIEDPNDPYPFNHEAVYSPAKCHLLTGRVPGEVQYYIDIFRYGPDIADKLHSRFMNSANKFKYGILGKKNKGDFEVINHPVNDKKILIYAK